MKLAPLTISVLTYLLSNTAQAVEIDAATGVFYFTSDAAKLGAAQTESGEGNLKFQSPRDPREVARDLAREELRKGNICLNQAERDLRSALQKKQITKICRELFRDDVAVAQAVARRNKWKADSLRCEASLEARETPSSISLVLTFRSRLMMGVKVPEKLARAGFSEEPRGWALPVHEAVLGESAEGWKGVLKVHACSVGEEVLEARLENFIEEAKATRIVASCRQRLDSQVERLGRLQSQFTQYVPFEWVADASGAGAKDLLQPLPVSTPAMSLEACEASREETGKRLENLSELAEVIAKHHDIPALDPKFNGRSPASEY